MLPHSPLFLSLPFYPSSHATGLSHNDRLALVRFETCVFWLLPRLTLSSYHTTNCALQHTNIMPSTSTSISSAVHASGDGASCPCPSSSSGLPFPALTLTRRGNERRRRQMAMGYGLLVLCCCSLVSLATAVGGGWTSSVTKSSAAGFLGPFLPPSTAAALGPASSRSSASRRISMPRVHVSYTGTSAGSSPTPTTPVVVQFNHSSVAITVSQTKSEKRLVLILPLIHPRTNHLTFLPPFKYSKIPHPPYHSLLLELPPAPVQSASQPTSQGLAKTILSSCAPVSGYNIKSVTDAWEVVMSSWMSWRTVKRCGRLC